MTTRPGDETERQFTGRHMLLIMIAFFGVIIAVNVTMAVLASKSWTGLVVKNSYVASQGFNDELAAARKQQETGWRSKVSYSDGALTFVLTDKSGDPVFLDSVSVAIGRPANESQDMIVEPLHTGSGVFTAETTLADGIWELRITGNRGPDTYRRDARFVVTSGEAVMK